LCLVELPLAVPPDTTNLVSRVAAKTTNRKVHQRYHLDESIGHLPLLKRCLERSLVIILRRKEPKECKWDATKVREKLGHLLA